MARTHRDGLEAEAVRLYRAAGVEAEVGASPLRLITALLGPGALRWADGDWIRGGGALGRINGEWRIYLRRSYPLNNLRFVALHELAHWAMPGATEPECDALAACLLAPLPAFRRALDATLRPRRSPARVYSDLGAWFRCTHSFAALRLGEVTGAPLALVAPASVRVRGEPYGWPEPAKLRALATSPAPGLVRAKLRDDPRRVVIRAG